MKILYNLSILLYHFFIHLAAPLHSKAKLWLNGRQHLFKKLKEKISNEEKIIWLHCASLGEFEQGRPLIEQLKKEKPKHKILLTFYSPSGYEIRKNYPLADYVFYMPLDTAAHARQFLDIVQPDVVYFIKYEFWYHFLSELKKRGIPTLLVAAVFREQQVFFKWYGGFFRKMLESFSHIFVQDNASLDLLKSIEIEHVSVAGDTRIDRVMSIAKEAKDFPLIAKFSANAPVLVAGSTWPKDEAILADFINKNHENDWKYIFAPHEIKDNKITHLESLLQVATLRYSKANTTNIINAKVLIIDNIGMLSALYQYGKVAYIGGGFGAGIHNTLEPIAFGLPVIFGLKYQKFIEAQWLVQHRGAFVVQHQDDFQTVFRQLSQEAFYKEASATARRYILQNQGATGKVLRG